MLKMVKQLVDSDQLNCMSPAATQGGREVGREGAIASERESARASEEARERNGI
jgi:hypothetical protein